VATRSRSGPGPGRRGGAGAAKEPAPEPNSVVDISDDPVIEAAGAQPATAAVSELNALDESHIAKLKEAQRSRVIKAVLLGVIGVIFIIFVVQNARPVSVDLLFGTITPDLIWVIVVAALLGAVAGYLVARPYKDLHFHLPERRGRKAPRASRKAPQGSTE
jgi:uncharacterized integral membrane protein